MVWIPERRDMGDICNSIFNWYASHRGICMRMNSLKLPSRERLLKCASVPAVRSGHSGRNIDCMLVLATLRMCTKMNAWLSEISMA